MSDTFWVGPARIVEAGRSPETSKRYWEVYCPTCSTHECLFGQGDPRLTERRDEHNRQHAERPLAWHGDPEHEQLAAAQATITRAVEWGENVLSMEDAVTLRSILSQSPTDALQAVKAAAWDEGARRVVEWNKAFPLLLPTDNPYRAIAPVPSTPEQPEGENRG